MKLTGKKILSMLLCMAMLFSVAACGSISAQAQALGFDQIEADVQEYITSFVDPSATVTSLYQSQNSISETQTEVSCQVTYSSDSGDGSGMVTLLYNFTGSEWTLSNCTADLSSASVAAPEATPEEAAPSTATGTLAGYTLTEVSTFENPSVGSLSSSRGLIVLDGNDTTTVYGPNGAAGEYTGYQELDYAEFELGFALVKEATGSALDNCRGLINGKGEVVLPCQEVWIDDIIGSRRFVEVYYSTGQCSANDDYLLCLQPRFDSGEKTYYTGYRKIFDLQTYSFVGDLEITSTDGYCIDANEAMVCVEEDGTYTLYDASGNIITQTTAGIYLSETLASFRMDGCTYVFDVNGERFTTADDIWPIWGDGDFFKVDKDDVYSLVDSNGNAVLPGMTFATINDCYNDVFSVKNADETAYQLIDVNGNILFESTDESTGYIGIINESAPGWWYCSPSIGTDTLISTYTTIEGVDSDSSLTPHDSNGNYTVLNTGETLALGTSAGTLTYGMIYARDSNGKYAIYDLFTGTALTEAKYSKVLYSAGYVYALDGSTWHVFQVENIYK